MTVSQKETNSMSSQRITSSYVTQGETVVTLTDLVDFDTTVCKCKQFCKGSFMRQN